MTHAESLCNQIELRSAELGSMADALSATQAYDATTGEWAPREILLHLVGAVSEIPSQVGLAMAGNRVRLTSSQRGGEYVDIAEIETASSALMVLREKLAAIDACVRGLSDSELERTVTVPVGEEMVREVPIGLVVRHMVADHLEEHIAQLRQALGTAAPAHEATGSPA